MTDNAIVHSGAPQGMPVAWQVLGLPEILAIFRLGDTKQVEKCPIWTL